jgi:hypothetical protein
MDRYRRILGVSENATTDEIREAYRERVQKYHPDLNDREDAEEQFKRVKQAYDALMEGRDEAETSSVGGDRGRWGPVNVDKDYNTGWRLVHQEERTGHGRRWAVVGQGTEDDAVRYIDETSEATTEAFFFGERESAERAYSEFRVEQEREADEQTRGKADVAFAEELDTLWNLYRADGAGGGVEWLVGTRVEGADHYVNAEGEHQTDPHWFESRGDAVEAYRRYVGTEESEFRTSRGAEDGREAGETAPPTLLDVLLDGIYTRRGRIKRYGALALVGLLGYVLGAAGIGPVGGTGSLDGSGLTRAVSSVVDGLDPVALPGRIAAWFRDYVERNGDLVLPISAFYATIAAAYLVHRFVGRGAGESDG